MRTRLFERNWASVLDSATRAAVAAVGSIDRKLFSDDTALKDAVDKIIAKQSLDVAKLDKSSARAKERKIERSHSDYGQRVTRTFSVLDITIPFTGESQSFEISPSNSHVMYDDVEVQKQAVVLTLPDDDNVQKELDTFVDRANENLDRLRKEVANSLPRVAEAVRSAAAKRKATIEEENSRDKGRSFPIDR